MAKKSKLSFDLDALIESATAQPLFEDLSIDDKSDDYEKAGFEVFDLSAEEERENLPHEKLDLKTKEGSMRDYIDAFMYDEWIEIDFEEEDSYL